MDALRGAQGGRHTLRRRAPWQERPHARQPICSARSSYGAIVWCEQGGHFSVYMLRRSLHSCCSRLKVCNCRLGAYGCEKVCSCRLGAYSSS